MQKIDWSLLKRSLREELDEEDSRTLEAWLDSSEERARFYARMKGFDRNGASREVDVAGNWDKFYRGTRARQRRIVRFISSCAAVLVLGVGAVFIWQSQKRLVQPESVQVASAGTGQVVVYTGGGKVVLSGDEDCQVTVGDSLKVAGKHDRLDYAGLGRKKLLIAERHKVEVPRGAEFDMTLSDGTQVRLNSETVMDYPVQFHGDSRRVALTGEAYFEVAPSDRPFIIDVNGCAVKVLGTHFNIRAYKDEEQMQTTLVQGSVEVGKAGEKVLLRPGEQAVLEKDGKLQKRKVDVGRYIAWTEGRFVFVDERLEDVMQTISRWYGVEYFFQRQDCRDIRINGTLERDNKVSDLLEKIGKSGVARFQVRNGTVVIN